MITLPHIPFIVAIVLYFISSVWSIGYIIKPALFNKTVAKWLMMMGFFVHSGFLIFLGLESGNIPITHFYESFGSLFVGLFFWALTFDGGDLLITVSLQSFWLIAHIIPIFIGYAAFTVSFSLSIMYLTQQRQLKHKLFGSLFR